MRIIIVVLSLVLAANAFGGYGSVVASFPSPAPSPQALAWANGYLYCYCNDANDLIWKVNPANGSTLGSFGLPFPGNQTGGLTYDGVYFWAGHRGQNRLYRFNTNGSVVTSFLAGWDVGYGLAWAGVHLWGSERTGSPTETYALYQMRPDGWIVKKVQVYAEIGDIAFDGKYLWVGEYDAYQSKYRVSAYREDGLFTDYFEAPDEEPYGATYGGGYLWIGTEPENGRIWKIDIAGVGVSPASLGKIKALYR